MSVAPTASLRRGADGHVRGTLAAVRWREVAAGNAAGEPRTWPSAPQPRNLWPLGIVAAFAVFIAATATLIVLSTLPAR